MTHQSTFNAKFLAEQSRMRMDHAAATSSLGHILECIESLSKRHQPNRHLNHSDVSSFMDPVIRPSASNNVSISGPVAGPS